MRNIHLLHTALIEFKLSIFILLEHHFSNLNWVCQFHLRLHSTNSNASFIFIGRRYFAIEIDMICEHCHVPFKFLKYFHGFGSTDKLFRYFIGLNQLILRMSLMIRIVIFAIHFVIWPQSLLANVLIAQVVLNLFNWYEHFLQTWNETDYNLVYRQVFWICPVVVAVYFNFRLCIVLLCI